MDSKILAIIIGWAEKKLSQFLVPGSPFPREAPAPIQTMEGLKKMPGLCECIETGQSVDKGDLIPDTVYINSRVLGAISQKLKILGGSRGYNLLPNYKLSQSIYGYLLLSEYEIRGLDSFFPGVAIDWRGIARPTKGYPFILDITDGQGHIAKSWLCMIKLENTQPILFGETEFHRIAFEGSVICPEPIFYGSEKCSRNL